VSSLPTAVKLPLRLFLLGFFAVVVQESAVSQISIFGVSADITPLVVMSVGLLCGSLTGAIFGFFTGLMIDLVLVQTLGVTSLLYIAIGYWAGRLRELRDPQAALTPLLVGASGAAVSLIGYSLMEFMLGVDAPVSFELLRQIVLGVVVDSIVAVPLYLLIRRVLDGALPDDPRRRRRRAYTTGGLSPLSRA
jgi:rod shape-determining protein MreD